MTSPTKPEIHNVSQRRQRRTERGPCAVADVALAGARTCELVRPAEVIAVRAALRLNGHLSLSLGD